jgi:hypothetical protein
VGDPRVDYTPRSDVTPEGELNALAYVYAFVLQRHHKRQQATNQVLTTKGHDDKKLADEQRRPA